MNPSKQFVNRLTSEGTRIRIPLIITFCVLWGVSFVINVFSSYYDSNTLLNRNIAQQFQQVFSFYDDEINDQATIQELILFDLVNNQTLINALANNDLKTLEADTSSIYQRLNSENQITHLYFIRKDRSVLYRAHSPLRKEDIINRQTMLKTYETQAVTSGMEFGILGTFTLRSVSPVYSDNQLVGYMEVGMELGHVIDKTERQFSIEIVELLDKSKLEKTPSAAIYQLTGRRTSENVLEDYVLVFGEYNDLDNEKISKYFSATKAPQDAIELESKIAVVARALEDYSGDNLGFQILSSDVSDFVRQRNENIIKTFIYHLIILVSGLLVFNYVLNFVEKINQAFQDEQAEQNEKLASALSDLHDAQQELIEKEKFASLGNLVAGVAHEVNTPIGICVTAISSYKGKVAKINDKLQQDQLKKSDLQSFLRHGEELISVTEQALHRTASLVHSFKQVATDSSPEEAKTVNLRQFVRDIVSTFSSELESYRHIVHLDVCDKTLSLDASALHQVLHHLLQNSITHAFDGENGHIYLNIDIKDNTILIDYKDDGKGLEQHLIDHLFEPFYTTKRHEGKSGLGTHIIYNLIKHRLKGELKVDAGGGYGLHYLISFPFEKPLE